MSVSGFCGGHRLGAIPSVPDKRDFSLSRLMGGTAFARRSKFSLFDRYPKIRNQGDRGSCGPHAACWCMGLHAAMEGVRADLSPLFAYWTTRYLMGALGRDSGVDNRKMAKALMKFGACFEADHGYELPLDQKPSRDAFRRGLKWQIKMGGYGWARTAAEAKGAIDVLNQPLIIAVPVYESFESPETMKTGFIPMPNTKSEKLLGYHDMAICGFDDNSRNGDFQLVNSWGSDVGDGGKFILSYDYPITEMMVIKESETGEDADDGSELSGVSLWWRKLRGMA